MVIRWEHETVHNCFLCKRTQCRCLYCMRGIISTEILKANHLIDFRLSVLPFVVCKAPLNVWSKWCRSLELLKSDSSPSWLAWLPILNNKRSNKLLQTGNRKITLKSILSNTNELSDFLLGSVAALNTSWPSGEKHKTGTVENLPLSEKCSNARLRNSRHRRPKNGGAPKPTGFTQMTQQRVPSSFWQGY